MRLLVLLFMGCITYVEANSVNYILLVEQACDDDVPAYNFSIADVDHLRTLCFGDKGRTLADIQSKKPEQFLVDSFV